MNENLRQAYVDKMNAQIQELTAQVQLTKAKASKNVAKAKIGINEQLGKIQGQEDVLKKKLEEIKNASADKFEGLKAEAETAWRELGKIFESTKH